MKKCKRSRECCYGNAAAPGWCAYDLAFRDTNPCPRHLEDYECFLIKMEEEEGRYAKQTREQRASLSGQG